MKYRLLCLALIPAMASCERIPSYPDARFSAELLGTLPGDSCSVATGVNDHGHVVGRSYNVDDGGFRAFWWTGETGMHELKSIGVASAVATTINKHGEIAGYIRRGPSEPVEAVRWQSVFAAPQVFEFAGVENSQVSVLNDRGEALVNGTHLWTSEGVQTLGLSGCAVFVGRDINDLGEIAGSGSSCEDGLGQRAVVINETGVRVLGFEAGAYKLNNVGDVTGWRWEAERVYRRGYWNSSGQWMGWAGMSNINDRGDLAATLGDGWVRHYVALRRGGKTYRLPDVLESSEFGGGLSNAGHVVGSSSRIGSMCPQAVIWREL